jgi:hypothetical protein
VAESREHDPSDTRWPCVRNARARAAEALGWEALTAKRPALSLVPGLVSGAVPFEQESEQAGAKRLLAAVAAASLRAEQTDLPTEQM